MRLLAVGVLLLLPLCAQDKEKAKQAIPDPTNLKVLYSLKQMSNLRIPKPCGLQFTPKMPIMRAGLLEASPLLGIMAEWWPVKRVP